LPLMSRWVKQPGKGSDGTKRTGNLGADSDDRNSECLVEMTEQVRKEQCKSAN
jgi:hypothetical protein